MTVVAPVNSVWSGIGFQRKRSSQSACVTQAGTMRQLLERNEFFVLAQVGKDIENLRRLKSCNEFKST